jgi:hypothetical protein
MLKRYPIDLTRAHIMLAADEHETDAENASGGCSSQAGRRLKQGDVMSGWRPFGNVIVDDAWA